MQRKMKRRPNNPIQVHAKNATITSKMKSNLRRLAKAPKLMDHIVKKATWTEGAFHTIDWVSHRSSVQNTYLSNRFITKFKRKIEVTRLNSGTGWIRILTKIIWNKINQVQIDRNLARHGKDEEDQREKERLQYISEITVYYNYRDDDKLGQADAIFYGTIQEHLYKESTLADLDTWLCSYRGIIVQSKKQAAIEKKKRAKRKKSREKALKVIMNNLNTHTNNPRRIYQTRQQRKRQETTNTIITTIESDSDSINSSEVSSGGNTDSDTSSSAQYREEDDSIQTGVYIV